METTEQEVFGINFFKKNNYGDNGIVKIDVPRFNSNGNIVGFTQTIAKFSEINGKLQSVNDDLGNFNEEKLCYLFISLHGNKKIANKVKILPPLKDKLIKFE